MILKRMLVGLASLGLVAAASLVGAAQASAGTQTYKPLPDCAMSQTWSAEYQGSTLAHKNIASQSGGTQIQAGVHVDSTWYYGPATKSSTSTELTTASGSSFQAQGTIWCGGVAYSQTNNW